MFKFFPDEGKEKDNETKETETTVIALRDSKEIPVQQQHYDIATKVTFSSTKKPASCSLKYVRIADLVQSEFVLQGDGGKVKGILESTSDLISGHYEGGFKLWECTFDLLTYLEDNKNELHVNFGTGKRVLDLGCGHGLLGLYALAQGASVVFQDYNDEVVNFLTIPNTVSNFGDEGLLRCRYFDGGWSSFYKLMKAQKETFQFDAILSSETIYNMDYLQDFIDLISLCLKPSGSLFLAAKTCYFGVGGGTKTFMKLVEDSSDLSVESVKVIKDGIQREILQVKHNRIN